MEFEDLKKVWDDQKLEYVFQINQTALHRRVARKHAQGLNITNASEWLMIVTNVLASGTILYMYLPRENTNISMLVISGWMLIAAGYVAYSRYRRLKHRNQLGRTLREDLQAAVDVARSQVRLASLGRWNVIPITIFSVAGLLEAQKPFWIAIAVIAGFAILNYLAGWESNYYKRRLKELELLNEKLENG